MRAIAGSMIILLAACSGGTEANKATPVNEAANQAAPKTPSDAQTKVQALPEGQRNGVLFRAIRDARQECQRVESSEAISTSNNTPVYMATCQDGAVFAVAIGDDGTASVRAVTPAEGK